MSIGFHTPFCARNVTIEYALLDISSGLAEDAFFSISENAPRLATRAGVNGKHAASLSSDLSVTVEITLFPESDAAKVLTAAYMALKESSRTGVNVLGAVPLTVKDASGVVWLEALEATMMSYSGMTLGADTGTVTFTFFVPDAAVLTLPSDLATQLNNVKTNLGVI